MSVMIILIILLIVAIYLAYRSGFKSGYHKGGLEQRDFDQVFLDSRIESVREEYE